MTRRMLTALIALVGLFVALYLTLYKVGLIGTLACGTGSCETVQLSRWSTFLGLPVAAWGAAYYAVVFALALAGVQDRWAESRRLTLALIIVTGWGVLFSAWLTYLELFVIHAMCRWCVVSAVLTALVFGLAVVDWRKRISA
ncbi:MAG TPA: vitamin K epoxide reductase family protein [Gemmatimonadaceae bacterium]|jgi:uncharacterized membrane protein